MEAPADISCERVAQTGEKCTASLILLHGSGMTGSDLRIMFQMLLDEELAFEHIRIIYPTAPLRPYTLDRHRPCTVWFDSYAMGLNGWEDTATVEAMATQLGRLIDAEVKAGIPLRRIVLGGYSMGGTMVFHLGYRLYRQVAGVLAISTLLDDDSLVYRDLEKRDGNELLPPLRQYHGKTDALVRHSWGKTAHDRLTSLGVRGEFFSLPGAHLMTAAIAHAARDWIASVLPKE